MRSLIIYAPNVGGGGGLVLLQQLLNAHWSSERCVAILDRRAQATIGEHVFGFDVHWSTSNVSGRLQAERLVARLAAPGDVVLCFHNLPPLLPSKGRVFVYVQNANLVGLIPTSPLRGWVRLRYVAERAIARAGCHRVERYMVQTESMASALANWFGRDAPPIDILPFATQSAAIPLRVPTAPDRRWDFLFVSDGALHKNHERLFAAWELLAQRGHLPSLAVTLHPARDFRVRRLLATIVQRSGARIEDLGFLPHAEVLAAYRKTGALIFPSLAESFGIPLLEARDARLPILAPELDYVRDLVDPEVTFDPTSVRSIARAVLRFLGVPAERHQVLSGQDVAGALIARAGES